MLVPKKNRLAVYTHLFREGVIVCEKNYFAPKHHQLHIPNVQVMKLMEELKAKGVVTEVFSWQWLYYILTDEGISYIRTYLHLTPETVPNTHKRVELVPLVPSYGSNQGRERSGATTNNARRGPSHRGNDFSSQPYGSRPISARN